MYVRDLRAHFGAQGTHSGHFLARMGTKLPLVERKSSGAGPVCIFGAPRGEKVRVFRLADVANVLYIMHGFDISLFSLGPASEGDFGGRNGRFG